LLAKLRGGGDYWLSLHGARVYGTRPNASNNRDDYHRNDGKNSRDQSSENRPTSLSPCPRIVLLRNKQTDHSAAERECTDDKQGYTEGVVDINASTEFWLECRLPGLA
jgi:hypothetical protein